MKTTIRNALELLAAINALSPMKFKGELGAVARLQLASNIRTLSTIQEDYRQVQNSDVQLLSGGQQSIPKDSPAFFQLEARMEAVLATEIDVPLHSIHYEALNLTENQIPAQVLAILTPIIRGLPALEEPNL